MKDLQSETLPSPSFSAATYHSRKHVEFEVMDAHEIKQLKLTVLLPIRSIPRDSLRMTRLQLMNPNQAIGRPPGGP